VRGTGRGPGIKSLVKSYGSTGHRVAVHVAETEGDLGGRAGGGETLRCAGDRFKIGELGACSEDGEADALSSAVDAG